MVGVSLYSYTPDRGATKSDYYKALETRRSSLSGSLPVAGGGGGGWGG